MYLHGQSLSQPRIPDNSSRQIALGHIRFSVRGCDLMSTEQLVASESKNIFPSIVKLSCTFRTYLNVVSSLKASIALIE